MKRRLFLLSILLALLPGFAQPSIKNDWNPILVRKAGITVVYEVKYGAIYTIECIGLWESKDEYLLTFKSTDGTRLQKSNIVSVYYKETSAKTFNKVE